MHMAWIVVGNKNRHIPQTLRGIVLAGGVDMNITTEEYTLLFNAVTDAIEDLEALKETLIQAQRQAEEIVINRSGQTP